MSRSHGGDWVSLLPLAEFAINATPSATTGTTPFAAVYGTEAAVQLPIDRALRNNTNVPAAEDVVR